MFARRFDDDDEERRKEIIIHAQNALQILVRTHLT